MPITSLFLEPFINFLSFKHSGISRLAKFFRSSHKVIDFGCGNGSYSHYFALHSKCMIIAVDWSPEALLEIKKTKEKMRIFPICADLHHLPFKCKSIDGAFTIDVFGHLKNWNNAINEIYRILKDGSPVFFHSECSDYKLRWPDRKLIYKNGRDILAEADGHISLFKSTDILKHLKRYFNITKFFSPAGLLGWVLGYPEKYECPFYNAQMHLPYLISFNMSKLKKTLIGHFLMRSINAISNRFEITSGLNGGGSVFIEMIKPAEAQKHSLSIDIIIPTFNRKSDLFALVKTLLPQCLYDDKIIIVSQDSIPLQIPASERIILLFNSPANLPLARNRGVLSSSNEIVLFLDDDIIPDQYLLENHRESYSNKNTNCIAGFVNDTRFEDNTESPSFFDIQKGMCIQNFSFKKPCKSISFMGAHFSLRRNIFKRTGLFDSNFSGNAFWEDIDFSFRLQKAGYQIYFNTKAIVTHKYSPTGGCRSSNNIRYLYDYMANTTYFALKYAPLPHIRTWFHYWKYRLEFETRSVNCFPLKHDPILLSAAFAGIMGGFSRFLQKGKRCGLPIEVINQWHNQKNGLSR